MAIYNVLLALHVLAVVWWIGGVTMVTFVLLPIYNRLPEMERVERIRQLQHRFVNQARLAMLVVGGAGFWMLSLNGGAARLDPTHGWWLDLMILVWGLFFVLLFVAEPLRLPDRVGLIHKRFTFLMVHAVLLVLALAAVFCGVIGARGGFA